MSHIQFRGLRDETGNGIVEVDSDEARISRMRRRLMEWAKALNGYSNRHETRILGVTLTYVDPDNDNRYWLPEHVSDFMSRVRKFAGKALLAYAWVGELQARGTVHYHVCLVLDPSLQWPDPDDPYGEKVVDLPFFDKLGWWSHGMTQAKFIYAASAQYLTKYVQKGREGGRGFPKGMRLFAAIIRCDVALDDKLYFRVSALPRYVRWSIVERVEFLIATWASSYYEGQVITGLDYVYVNWSWGPLEGGGWLIQHNDWEKMVQSAYQFLGLAGYYDAQTDSNDWMDNF